VPDTVFLVSNKRILFMSYQSVLGNWTMDWEYGFGDITGPPRIERVNFQHSHDFLNLTLKGPAELGLFF